MSEDSRSRLCPDCRSDSIPRQACTACAQARRIDELEMTVEDLVKLSDRLAERIEKLEPDEQTDTERITEIALLEADSP